MTSEVSFFGRHRNIYIYVPNLIGYARVVAALYALGVAFVNPYHCIVFYLLGFICDELDGRFARKFNQTSTLGAVLDMVTDRVSTTGLLAILCKVYPQGHLLFLSLLMLDIFSHWFQMYATLLAGNATHKDTSSRSWWVRTYYQHRLFMGYCCISCEALYLCLYTISWPSMRVGPELQVHWALVGVGPFPLQVLGVPLDRYSLAVMLICLPGVVIKQLTNWYQLKNAMRQLVDHDLRKMS